MLNLNSFARSIRSSSKGLATLNAPSGTFIAYATSPGSVASEGTRSNGLYTVELIRHMKTPGLRLEYVFKRVRLSVQVNSDNKQVPWDASSFTGNFFFVLLQGQSETQVASTVQHQSSTSAEAPKTIRADESAWKDIQNSKDPEDIRFFLEEFLDSSLAKTAKFKLKPLQCKQESEGSWIEPISGIKFLRIPRGTFLMGSPSTEEGRKADKENQHTVSVRKFRLSEMG